MTKVYILIMQRTLQLSSLQCLSIPGCRDPMASSTQSMLPRGPPQQEKSSENHTLAFKSCCLKTTYITSAHISLVKARCMATLKFKGEGKKNPPTWQKEDDQKVTGNVSNSSHHRKLMSVSDCSNFWRGNGKQGHIKPANFVSQVKTLEIVKLCPFQNSENSACLAK